MVLCLERGADLHISHLMSLPLTVSCFSKIQIGFTFLVLAYQKVSSSSPRQRAVKRVCCVFWFIFARLLFCEYNMLEPLPLLAGYFFTDVCQFVNRKVMGGFL